MKECEKVQQVVELYFQTTYHEEASAIKGLFHPTARINGFIAKQFYTWSIDEFVANICARPVAADNNEKYDKEIISIKINAANIAYVKARNLVGDTYFIDQINLIRLNDEWKIISKVFTDC